MKENRLDTRECTHCDGGVAHRIRIIDKADDCGAIMLFGAKKRR
ncbi:MAG: hypothetical protein ACI97A_002086 [Planctomycetota bacterium]|jgi:hypothetical protein